MRPGTATRGWPIWPFLTRVFGARTLVLAGFRSEIRQKHRIIVPTPICPSMAMLWPYLAIWVPAPICLDGHMGTHTHMPLGSRACGPSRRVLLVGRQFGPTRAELVFVLSALGSRTPGSVLASWPWRRATARWLRWAEAHLHQLAVSGLFTRATPLRQNLPAHASTRQQNPHIPRLKPGNVWILVALKYSAPLAR